MSQPLGKKPFLPSEIIRIVASFLPASDAARANEVSQLFRQALKEDLVWFLIADNLGLGDKKAYKDKAQVKARVIEYYQEANEVMANYCYKKLRGMGTRLYPLDLPEDTLESHAALREVLVEKKLLPGLIKALAETGEYPTLLETLLKDYLQNNENPLDKAIWDDLEVSSISKLINLGAKGDSSIYDSIFKNLNADPYRKKFGFFAGIIPLPKNAISMVLANSYETDKLGVYPVTGDLDLFKSLISCNVVPTDEDIEVAKRKGYSAAIVQLLSDARKKSEKKD